MTVKIVTDSTADLPPQLVRELGIAVVPVYVRFGDRVYRDGIDISQDEFYQKLVQSPVHPTTSQPSPQDFAEVYTRLAKETDEIVSIHLSAKMSGTCQSALRGGELAPPGCQVEVIDSSSVSTGLGLPVLAAARLAKMGESLQAVIEGTKQAIARTHVFGLLDTLKYLSIGGRLGKAKTLLGTLLSVKPLLTMREGEILPAGMARTRAKGLDRLVEIVKSAPAVQELAITYSTLPEEAASLKERFSAFIARNNIHITQLGPALGAHGGPGIVILAFREKLSSMGESARGELSKRSISLPSIHLPKIHRKH